MTNTDIISQQLIEEILQDDDPVHQAEVVATLALRAKQLGCKGEFEKLYKAAKKQERELAKQSNQQSQFFNSVTDFGDEKYDNMRCGSWIADRDGVRTYTIMGEVVACYHPILPVQLLVNAETGKEKIKIAYKKRNSWKEIIIDKGTIASANKIVQLAEYGVSVTSENARNLVKYLNDIENFNADRIQEQISTSKLGWIKNEFMPFGANILFDNETRFKETFESIHPEGSMDKWYELVREIRKSNRFEPKIYLAASLASVLVEPLGALPFIVSLWGDSGKGKTVALMLAASVWADPDGTKYITDPKSTVTALEVRMDFLNNFPMLIDDLAQVKEKYQGDFSELVYYLCSGKGKDRANASLGLNKAMTWKNVILTNSERSMIVETMQGGAINRIIDVEMSEGYIFENGNKVADTLRQNYGFAGYEFVKVIQDLGIEKIKGIQQMYYQMIIDKAKELGVEKEEKQILPMSIILTADMIANTYMFHDSETLDFDTCVNLLKNKGEVSENDRAYEYIMSEVAVHINNFKPNKDTGEYRGECWGCIEHEYVIIQNNIFNDMCKRGNFSSKAFLSWAAKRDLIQTSGGKNSKTKWMNGANCRCVFLKMDKDSSTPQGFIQTSEDEQSELPFMN